jgi:hypothetical protein
MSSLVSRATSGAQLSTTAVAAIVTGIGVVMLCLLSALIFLLVRAVRTHKQLLADLEDRGLSVAQAQKEVKKDALLRPRAVLRRNTILPFNNTTGWGTLPSVETIRSAESSNVAHYVPPMPTGPVKRASGLAWPFSARRLTGHSVQLKSLKRSRLSTVIESPQPSPLVPGLSNTNAHSSRLSIAQTSDYGSRASSSQSLLQSHPAFRASGHSTGAAVPSPRSDTGSFRLEANNRLHRARSIAEVPSLQAERPQLRARSVSLCSQAAGKAPDVILPPLPLDIARIKDEAKRGSQLRHVPSKQSMSSVGSVDSGILATRPSPVVHQPAQFRGQKITKPNAKGSSFAGRTFRDTLELRTKARGSRESLQFNTTQTISAPVEIREMPVPHRPRPDVNAQLRDVGNAARPAASTSPVVSPRAMRGTPTPKRRSKTFVSSAGSPERQFDGLIHSSSMTRPAKSPKRQHSQTSSRSSGGNPFQWDPTPLISSTGKPSALKGSPSARQGHRRKNSVRISLVPTIHGLPSRTSSLSAPQNGVKGDIETTVADGPNGLGLELATARSLPTPPTSTTFEPDLKLHATSIKASLTTTSPTLPLVEYDQTYVVFPTDTILPHLSEKEQKRLSNGSMFSLSRFPATPSIIEPMEVDMSYVQAFSNQPFDFQGNWMPDTPYLQQYPFGMQTPDRQGSPEECELINLDEYDPEQPSCIYQTPTKNSARPFKSACTTIPEESSVSSNKTLEIDQSRYDDSPPVSPKTFSPPRFTLEHQAVFNLPIRATVIPEESPETIDPAVLTKDAFSVLNSRVSDVSASFYKPANSSRLSFVMPPTASSAQAMLEPLLDAALPSNNPLPFDTDSPTIGHVSSRQSSSEYSSRSPSPSPIQELPCPVFPCSPRPVHAQLPPTGLSINFAEMPKLKPSPRGPRGSPPRPLRSSIAQLRRMNSDAADAKKEKGGRGERRYLRLGREDSVQVPGDESWLDDLEDNDAAVELDEAEGRRLVGDLLEEWDEGCTMLDLDEGNTLDSTSTIKPTQTTIEKLDQDTTAGASPSPSTSSIWEDSEKFWTHDSSTATALGTSTPPRPGSPNKPKDHYQPLASSPLVSTLLSTPKSSPSPSRKRHFEVAKDDLPNQEDNPNPCTPRTKKRENNARRNGVVGGRYRKRNALGVGTPNVRIQITSPGGSVMGTPGSLYDSQGFLRV